MKILRNDRNRSLMMSSPFASDHHQRMNRIANRTSSTTTGRHRHVGVILYAIITLKLNLEYAARRSAWETPRCRRRREAIAFHRSSWRPLGLWVSRGKNLKGWEAGTELILAFPLHCYWPLFSFLFTVGEDIASFWRPSTQYARSSTSSWSWCLSRFSPLRRRNLGWSNYLVVISFSSYVADQQRSTECIRKDQRFRSTQNIAGIFCLWMGWKGRRMAQVASTDWRENALLSSTRSYLSESLCSYHSRTSYRVSWTMWSGNSVTEQALFVLSSYSLDCRHSRRSLHWTGPSRRQCHLARHYTGGTVLCLPLDTNQ